MYFFSLYIDLSFWKLRPLPFFSFTFYYKIKQMQKTRENSDLSWTKQPWNHHPGQEIELGHPPKKPIHVYSPNHSPLPPSKITALLPFIVVASLNFSIVSSQLCIPRLYSLLCPNLHFQNVSSFTNSPSSHSFPYYLSVKEPGWQAWQFSNTGFCWLHAPGASSSYSSTLCIWIPMDANI